MEREQLERERAELERQRCIGEARLAEDLDKTRRAEEELKQDFARRREEEERARREFEADVRRRYGGLFILYNIVPWFVSDWLS